MYHNTKYFKFCTHIHRIARNKSPLKISGKVTVGLLRDSRKFSGHIWRIARSSLRQQGFLVQNLTNLDHSERNAPRSFSPDCIDVVLIQIDLDYSRSIQICHIVKKNALNIEGSTSQDNSPDEASCTIGFVNFKKMHQFQCQGQA